MSDLIPDEERAARQAAEKRWPKPLTDTVGYTMKAQNYGIPSQRAAFLEGWLERARLVSPVTREALAEMIEAAGTDWNYRLSENLPTRPLADEVADAVFDLLSVSPPAEVKPFRLTVPDLEMESADYWRGVADAEAEITSEYGIPVSPESEGKK